MKPGVLNVTGFVPLSEAGQGSLASKRENAGLARAISMHSCTEQKLLTLLQAALSERIFRRATVQIGVETSKAVDLRRVFVVDDNEITRAALQFMLHDEIETHELATPEEAFARDIDWLKPHVVLLGASYFKQEGPA